LIACLRSVDAKTLTASMQSLHSMYVSHPAQLPINMYGPRIDKEAERPFMPRDPRYSYLSAQGFDREVEKPSMHRDPRYSQVWAHVVQGGSEAGHAQGSQELFCTGSCCTGRQ
jgi:hypothetical protein